MGILGTTKLILLIIIAAVVYFIYSRSKKQPEKGIVSNKKPSKGQDNLNAIPDACPHCKNPNTKGIRLCEWCGGQIA